MHGMVKTDSHNSICYGICSKDASAHTGLLLVRNALPLQEHAKAAQTSLHTLLLLCSGWQLLHVKCWCTA